MRICYLGDANVQVRRVAEYFAAAGNEVHLVTARPAVLEGIHVHPFDGPLARGRAAFLLGLPAARRLVHNLRPDIVHAFYATSYGLVASLVPGPPVALSPMGSDILISARRSRLSAAMVRRGIARAEAIFSVAPHMTRRLVELGADPALIHTFPRGVDLDRFVWPERTARGDGPVILSNRKLEPVYNIEQLVRAAPRVLAASPKARFLIYGEGSLRRQLEELAAAEGVARSVFFEGVVDHDQVPAVLARADIYVSCSRSDGTSVSLLEAMACGLYPVVSDIEANRAWVEPGGGHLFPLDDARALADAILEASQRLDSCRAALESNRRRVEQDASWRSNMPRMQSVYRLLVKDV